MCLNAATTGEGGMLTRDMVRVSFYKVLKTKWIGGIPKMRTI